MRFYQRVLGLELVDEQAGHHARFGAGAAFLCLERKGAESYPSRDKAVVFLEVSDLDAMIEKVGRERILRLERAQFSQRPAWAVLHDPEGYNVVLMQSSDEDRGPDRSR